MTTNGKYIYFLTREIFKYNINGK